MANAQGIRAGRAYVELATNASKLNAGLAAARGKLESFATSAKSILTGAFVVSAPIALAVKQFAAFDDQMRLVRGVTKATADEFATLTERAKELGRTTSWTAAQVAQGMTSLGRAGFSTGEIDNSIAAVMDLARATGTEIETAADIAGNAIRSFNLDASQMAKVCDVLTATANGSAQTIEDLGEAFKYVAPIANSAGLTIQDTAKLVGALANFGVKGSQAGTVLKAIQTRLASDKAAQAKYAELGIDTTDAEGNIRKVNEILTELGQKIQNMPSGERLATIKTLFGQYGLSGVSVTAANFEELNKAIDAADGTAARVAATMDAGLGGAIRLTTSAIEGLSLSVGEALVPALSKVAESTQNAAAWLTKFTAEHPSAISSAALLAVKVGAGAAAALAISKAFSLALSAARALTVGYQALTRVIDFVVGATRAAAAAQQAEAATAAALANVEKAALAVKTATTAETKAAASAELLFATSQYKAAAAAQATAKAQAAARAAIVATTAAALAAVGVVAGLAAAYYRWATAADRAATKARDASDAIDATNSAREQQRAADVELFNELVSLSNHQALTSEQFARAQFIVAELSDRYGDLGIKCNDAARSILGMADAQDRFNAAQNAQRIQEAKDKIETFSDEIERNNAALKNMDSFFGGVGMAIKSGFSADEMLSRRQELLDRNRELERLIRQQQNTLNYTRATGNAVPQPTAVPSVAATPTATPNAQTIGPAVPDFAALNDSQINALVKSATTGLDAGAVKIQNALEPIEQFDAILGAQNVAAQTASGLDFTPPPILVEPLVDEFNDIISALDDVGGDISRSFESSGTFSAFETISDDGAAQLNETKRQTRILNDVYTELRRANDEELGDWI